ncbi:MAG: Hsp20/alpha crystallin family protein [Syntrophaceae bacterium]|nr:Hsp20/alpha crystallin family protein [Syntrophaceae bacterium]
MNTQGIQSSEKTGVNVDKGELTHEGDFFTPAVDIYETSQEIVMNVDLPGVKPEDLDIDLRDDTLSIIGKVTETDNKGTDLLVEYKVGHYYRSFLLTDVIDRSAISANLSDGVLKLRLPKAAKAVPRKIPISEG